MISTAVLLRDPDIRYRTFERLLAFVDANFSVGNDQEGAEYWQCAIKLNTEISKLIRRP